MHLTDWTSKNACTIRSFPKIPKRYAVHDTLKECTSKSACTIRSFRKNPKNPQKICCTRYTGLRLLEQLAAFDTSQCIRCCKKYMSNSLSQLDILPFDKDLAKFANSWKATIGCIEADEENVHDTLDKVRGKTSFGILAPPVYVQ